MRNKFLYIIVLSIIFSCNKKVETFYDNGNVKTIYYEKEGKKDGVYKEFYNNEVLKEVHVFKDGVKIDSSIYYYSPPNSKIIKHIHYWRDSVNFQINYNKNGIKIKEGNSYIGKNYKTGKWKLYNDKGELDSIVEYKNINNNAYVNQIYVFDSKGDTLRNKGNYYEVYFKDTIPLGSIAKIRFFLYQPYYNYDSDIEVILPYNDDLLNNDFSNIFYIERDTFASLKNDKIPHPEVPSDIPINHYIQFGLEYDKPGKKRIRGVLIEYHHDYLDNVKYPDSLYKIERRLYFDETFYIKDTITKPSII